MDSIAQDNSGTDRAFMRFGVQSLHDQLSALTREIEGVIEAADPEYVHRMRVASRRIRTRLALFGSCLPDKKGREWNNSFRTVTKALGAARDVDVQIILVESFLAKLSSRETSGMNRLLLRLRQKRRGLQKDVVRTMNRLQHSGVIHDMEGCLRILLSPFILEKDTGSQDQIFRAACEEISARLSEVLGYTIYIHDPARVTELHAMRIAAKHLRYSMESFEPAYEKKLARYIKVVKNIQEMLGDIHDCDVWLEFLPEFLAQERELALEYIGHTRSVGRLKSGIEVLQADRRAFREKRYREFVGYWEENTAVWPALLAMLTRLAGKEEQPVPEV